MTLSPLLHTTLVRAGKRLSSTQNSEATFTILQTNLISENIIIGPLNCWQFDCNNQNLAVTVWWLDVKPHRGIDSEQSKVLNGLCSRLRCTSLDVVGRIKKDAEARAGLQLLQSNPKKKKTYNVVQLVIWGMKLHFWSPWGMRGSVTHLMTQEECFELTFGPVVHGVGQ